MNAVSGNPSLNEAPDQVEDEDMCTELMDASNGRVSGILIYPVCTCNYNILTQLPV